MQDRVELPEPVTLIDETVHEVLLVARFTTPANPLSAVIMIVEVLELPAFTATAIGFTAVVKSCVVKVTVAE
jgi:hypothetical protein